MFGSFRGLVGGLLFLGFRNGGFVAVAFVFIAGFGAGQHGIGDHACVFAQFLLDRGCDLGVVFQVFPRVLAALADALAVKGEPCAGFLDDAGIDAEVDDLALFRDAFAVHDVEFDDAEGGGQACS